MSGRSSYDSGYDSSEQLHVLCTCSEEYTRALVPGKPCVQPSWLCCYSERQQQVRFETERFQFDEGTRLSDLQRQARRTAEAGVSGVVLMPSRYKAEAARQDELFLRACRDAGLAIVLIQRNLRGIGRILDYDLVAADDFDGGLRCTQHLLKQGRQRLAFITGSPTSSHEGRLSGYLTALHHAAISWGPFVLEQPSGLDSKDSYVKLADQLSAGH